MAKEIVETKAIEQVSDSLYKGVSDIIDNARQEVVVYVNKHSDLMFWHIGRYINEDMGYKQYSAYGSKILATLSQRLTARYGKGYTGIMGTVLLIHFTRVIRRHNVCINKQ